MVLEENIEFVVDFEDIIEFDSKLLDIWEMVKTGLKWITVL